MKQPLYLLPVVGFSGNTAFNGQPAQILQASATASADGVLHQYCRLTLSSGSSSFNTNGSPTANPGSCSIMSNGVASGIDVTDTGNTPAWDFRGALQKGKPGRPLKSLPGLETRTRCGRDRDCQE